MPHLFFTVIQTSSAGTSRAHRVDQITDRAGGIDLVVSAGPSRGTTSMRHVPPQCGTYIVGGPIIPANGGHTVRQAGGIANRFRPRRSKVERFRSASGKDRADDIAAPGCHSAGPSEYRTELRSGGSTDLPKRDFGLNRGGVGWFNPSDAFLAFGIRHEMDRRRRPCEPRCARHRW